MFALRSWPIERAKPLPIGSEVDSETVRWRDDETPLTISEVVAPGDRFYRLRMDPDLAVDIRDDRIVTRASVEYPKNTLDHFLADQVIPRVLAHAGAFVFHAGAVSMGDHALVFMGRSGRGKSTLCASFDQAGFELIGDDAMIASWEDELPQVRAVYPSLRLFPDSLDALIPGTAEASPMAHYSVKQRIEVKGVGDPARPAIPVTALFAIAPPSAEDGVAVRRLSAAAACMILVESSFALDPADLTRARQRLEEASRLAGLIPAFEISYPRDYARLAEVRDCIADKVTELERA